VTGPEGDSQAEEIARIIRQRAENTYRQGMTASEHANAAYQLSLYGMSEKDIAEEMQMPKAQVRAARKLGKSQTGTVVGGGRCWFGRVETAGHRPAGCGSEDHSRNTLGTV
jgi:hypothetical protein